MGLTHHHSLLRNGNDALVPSGKAIQINSATYDLAPAWSMVNNFAVETWYQIRKDLTARIVGSSGFTPRFDFSEAGPYFKVTKYAVVDIYIGDSSIIKDGLWHHFLVSYSSTKGVQIYIDGVLNGTSSNTQNCRADLQANGIGNGRFENYRIWNNPLTAAEAYGLAKGIEMPDRSKLYMEFLFDEPYGNFLDTSGNNRTWAPRVATRMASNVKTTTPWTVNGG